MTYELPNDLRLRILGNKETLGKSQIWVDTWPSTQSFFQKLNFGNSSQKNRKSRYQAFLFRSSFTRFFYFVSNISPRIIWTNKVLVLTQPSLLQTLFFWHFVHYQRIFPIFKENIKQVTCVKIPNFMVFCQQYFAYLGVRCTYDFTPGWAFLGLLTDEG